MSQSHTPMCQYKNCSKEADDYDQRFQRVVFFCNDAISFHDPKSYSKNSFNKRISVKCGQCESMFTLSSLSEETVEEFECPECGHNAKLLV